MIRVFSVTESASRYEVQSLQQVQDLFLANPSVQNGIAFCDALIELSDFFDSLNLVMGKLPPMERCFYVAFVMMVKYYQEISGIDKERFVSTFASTKSLLPSKARVTCIELLLKNNLDCGFLIAAADPTSDQVLGNIKAEWENL
jgi:hypothetical protein